MMKELLEKDATKGSVLREVNIDDISCKVVSDSAIDGDSLAMNVMDMTTKYVALGCINLCRMFEPEVTIKTTTFTDMNAQLKDPMM